MRGIANATRTSQPTAICDLDWNNPILKAINPIAIYCPVGNRMHEFVKGGQATSFFGSNDLLSPNVRMDGPMGPAGYTGACGVAGQTQGYWDTGIYPDSSFKFLLGITTTPIQFYAANTFPHGVHDGTRRYYIGEFSSTTGDIAMGWGSNGNIYTRQFAPPVNVPQMVAQDVTPNLTQIVYVNGVALGSAAVTWSGGAATRVFSIGHRSNVSASGVGTEISHASLTHLVVMGRNNIPAGMHQELYRNPWQLFAPISRPIFIGSTVTVVSVTARPNSDIFTGGWTGNPDNVNRFANINGADSTSATDASYVTSPTITGGEYNIYGLDLAKPAGVIDVNYRADFVGASAQVRISLLDASNAVMGVGAWQTVTSTFAPYTSTITTTGTSVRVKVEVQ